MTIRSPTVILLLHILIATLRHTINETITTVVHVI